jgi:hypothetical protein
MPYIGRSPQVGNYSKLDSIAASFNDSLTDFNLAVSGSAYTPGTATQLIISIDGVIQEPESAYTVSGSTISFTSAPATGASFYGIGLGDVLDIGTPSDGTVTAAKLVSGAVTAGKIASGGVSANTQLAAGVVTNHALATNAIESDNISPSANVAYANRSQKFTLAQQGNTYAFGSLTANTRPDMNTANFFSLTVGGNITIYNPTNQKSGQSGAFVLTNGGSYAVSWGGDFKFASGTAPTITASGTDVISYYIGSANNIYVDALQALS